MAKYKLIADGCTTKTLDDGSIKVIYNITGIKDNEQGWFIPIDPANTHYQEYQQWLEEGNEPDPPYTLEELKQLKKQEIKQAFLSAPNDGFVSSSLNIKVDCKRDDYLNLQGAYDLAISKNLSTITIRDYNNEYHDLTPDQLKTLLNELLDYYNLLYQKKWNLEQQIDTATTLEETVQIKW